MRYKYALTTLADTIATHNTESIKREIQLTAFSSLEADEKSKKLANLRLAQSFISENPALPTDWRISLDCFKALANYFMQQPSVENYEERAMCCWYLLLNQAIPQKIKTADNKEVSNNFPYEQIIIFGTAYLPEPHQFAGFIGWLLTRYVSQHIIRASTLLYQFFNYHSHDLSVIQHTYELIKNFSPMTGEFLRYTTTSPCLLRGFTNSHHDGKTESYNVMGNLFEHKKRFVIHQDQLNEDSDFTLSENYTFTLFALFGFDFIKKLLEEDSDKYHNSLSTLLNSQQRHIILDEFPMRALSGELSYKQTGNLLKAIGSAYHYNFDRIAAIGRNAFSLNPDGTCHFPEEAALQANFIGIITKNVFYIHVDGMFSLERKILHNAVTALCVNPHYKSPYHLPFLISLSKKLKHKNLLEAHNILINFIADYLIALGNGLNDDYAAALYTIKNEFLPIFENKLATYCDNIDNAIDGFLSGKNEYDTIEQIGSAQLSTVNLIYRLTPELMETIDYPHGYYKLKHAVIEKCFIFLTHNKKTFDSLYMLGSLLRTMDDTIENRIRILKESFLLSKNIDYLKEIIIYALKQDFEFISDFFYQPFGNESYILDAIAEQENPEFREWMLSVIPQHHEQMLSCIKRSFEEGTIAKDHLFQSAHLTQKIAFDAVNFILEHHNLNQLKWKICEKYICMMHENAFSQELIRFAFFQAIANGINLNFIYFLCNLKNTSLFPQEIIREGVDVLLKSNQWPVIRILCGLSNIHVNEEIIAKNNIALLISALKERKKYALLQETYILDIRTQAYELCENNNTLFHLAANSGCYQTMTETFYFFRKYLSAKAICDFLHNKNSANQIPHCPIASEDAEKINTFLSEKRQQYKNCSIVDGGLWHHREDRKRQRHNPIVISDTSDTDTDDEHERSRGRRLENDQDEIEQLLRL